MRLYNGVRYFDRPSPINVRRLDFGALPMIAKFHRNGIRVDLPYLASLETDFTSYTFHRTIDGKDREFRGLLGLEAAVMASIGPAYQDFHKGVYRPFNIGSPDQVGRLLFQHLKIQGSDPVAMTASEGSDQFATGGDILEKYRDRHPACGLILDYRELAKLVGTYVRPLQLQADPITHRIHTRFSVTTAATGRLASFDPNLQNIPTRSLLGKLIRAAFIASPGNVLVSNDLSQIEMRWAAHLAQDPTMMGVFIREEDVHDRTACEIFGRSLDEITALKKKVKKGLATSAEEATYKYFTQFERLPSKTIGFGILYGQTAQGLYDSIMLSKDPNWSDKERQDFESQWTLSRCEKLIEQWYGVYNRIREWMELQFSRARRWGKVWDAFGRFRHVPEVYSAHKRIKNEGLRKAGNHGVQSSAQGTIKLAMAELDPISDFFNSGPGCVCLPLLQIHDELMHELDRGQARDYADVASEIMEGATPISIPIKSSSDIAERWSDLK
jgi:DNA polymerase-1